MNEDIPQIQVCRPGSKVTIGGNISAEVLQLSVGDGLAVQYQVAWWDGNSRRCEWLHSFEVSFDEKQLMQIGFKP